MKTLVIQTAFPGDAILTLPLVQELKKNGETLSIDVLCIPSTRIIFEASPFVDKVIVYDKHGEDKNLFSFIRLIRQLKSNNYGKVISPHRSSRSAIIARFTSAQERITFDKSSLSFLYTDLIEYQNTWHEVRRNLSLLGSSNYDEEWKVLPQVNINNEIKKYVDNLCSGIDLSKSIIIAPGSVWETKKYPVEYYKQLVDELLISGFNIIFIGAEEDKELAENINGEPRTLNLCGKTNFLQSIYLMSKCKLVICNDSAPTHLAMCADASVLTIYCSTVSEFGFFPYNAKGNLVSYKDLYCKPCGIHGYQKCPEGHFKCGLELKPRVVLDKIFEITQ